MKLGIVIYSNDAELVWNAFRFANLVVEQKDEIKIFLLAKGVEYETLSNEKYPITELAKKFISSGGKILACGICLKLRQKDGSQLCPISTMKDLYQMVKDCDKVLTF